MKSELIAQIQSTTSIQASIVNATGFSATNPGLTPTNTVLVATAHSTEESVIRSLSIASDDTSVRVIQFWKSKDGGTTKYLIGMVSVPALAGYATLINVDVLRTATITGTELDENLQPIIRLENNGVAEQLYACVITAAVTASKTIYINGSQGNYIA